MARIITKLEERLIKAHTDGDITDREYGQMARKLLMPVDATELAKSYLEAMDLLKDFPVGEET